MKDWIKCSDLLRTKSNLLPRWATFIGMAVIVAFNAAALVGCGERIAKPIGKNTIDVGGNGYDAFVRDVVTPAGVRCVVMTGSGRGGISCDWENAPLQDKVLPTKPPEA